MTKEEGNWVVEIENKRAKGLGKKFGQYSYYAGGHMDSKVDWLNEEAY